MNRSTALCIERAIWMDETFYSDVIAYYNIEATQGKEPKLGLKVIWLDFHDEHIFQLAKGDMTILSGLNLWYDDVDTFTEIHITEANYLAYDDSKFYKTRTGKYDPETEEMI